MTRGYRRTVAHLGYEWTDAKRAEQEARQRFYDALEGKEQYIIPSSREYKNESELDRQIIEGSRLAEDILESGGTTDEAAKEVSRKLNKDFPNQLNNWVAEQTARRCDHD